MWRRCLTTFPLAFAAATSVNAGAIVDFVPTTPGPYAPGQHVEFDFQITQEPGGQDRYLRLIQFNFARTDPAITLDDAFRFDYSAQGACSQDPALCGRGYVEFSSLYPAGVLVPAATVYLGFGQDSDLQIRLPEAGPITVGSLGLSLPTQPGVYLFDALNATPATGNPNEGATISFGFQLTPDDPIVYWYASGEDVIGGGTFLPVAGAGGDLMFDFQPSSATIVPEPATLACLAFGGAAFVMRRGRRRHRLRP